MVLHRGEISRCNKVNERKNGLLFGLLVGGGIGGDWLVGYTTCFADIHPTHYLGQSIEVDSQ